MNAIKSFVRRNGQITGAQANALTTFAQYIIPSSTKELLHLPRYFDTKEVIAEIGFGMGLATYQIAQNNPDKGYLGFEVHTPGVGKLLMAIDKHQLSNLYLIHDDVAQVLPTMVPDASLAGIHVFYPDPWPKKRHQKRRLLQKEFIQLLVSKLKVGSYLYIVSDWQEYAEDVLALLQQNPQLQNRYPEFATPQEWRPITRFNEKANQAGRASWELYFVRK
jgi:tRNA (guanine-N7-)-methyltransferase